MSSLCKKLLIAAESRRLGRTPVVVRYEDIDSSSSEEEEVDDDKSSDDEMETDEMETDVIKKRKNSQVKSPLNKKAKMSWKKK